MKTLVYSDLKVSFFSVYAHMQVNRWKHGFSDWKASKRASPSNFKSEKIDPKIILYHTWVKENKKGEGEENLCIEIW